MSANSDRLTASLANLATQVTAATNKITALKATPPITTDAATEALLGTAADQVDAASASLEAASA